MNTPRAIALVWKAHPGLMILLILLNIFFGLFPVVQVWISKLLIDTVVITVANKQAAIPFLANIPFAGHILHVLLSVKILAIFSLLGILALSNIVAGLANPAFKYVSEERPGQPRHKLTNYAQGELFCRHRHVRKSQIL